MFHVFFFLFKKSLWTLGITARGQVSACPSSISPTVTLEGCTLTPSPTGVGGAQVFGFLFLSFHRLWRVGGAGNWGEQESPVADTHTQSRRQPPRHLWGNSKAPRSTVGWGQFLRLNRLFILILTWHFFAHLIISSVSGLVSWGVWLGCAVSHCGNKVVSTLLIIHARKGSYCQCYSFLPKPNMEHLESGDGPWEVKFSDLPLQPISWN